VNNKSTFKLPFLLLACALMTVTGTAAADQCGSISQFISLAKQADQCVVKIRKGDEPADSVLKGYEYCSNVRQFRGDIEKQMNELPVATFNQCAQKNLQAYTDAATAMHKLYQIELGLK
jgi:hypothetical protein